MNNTSLIHVTNMRIDKSSVHVTDIDRSSVHVTDMANNDDYIYKTI